MQNQQPPRPSVEELERQVKVSKLLGMGFVLSIAPLFGVGSLVALILGWKARRIIEVSEGRIGGRFLAWWCILVGGPGFSIVLVAAIVFILEAALKHR